MKNLSIVMYHYTRDLRYSRYPEIKGLDYNKFEQQLLFFKNNMNVVTMEEVLDASCGKDLPENAVLLTFDDGYIDNFLVAFPLLKKYGMQGSFFVPGITLVSHTLLNVNKIHFTLASGPIELIKQDLLRELDLRRDGKYANLPSNIELYKKYGKAGRYDSADVSFVKKLLQTALPQELRTEIASVLFEKYVGVSESVFHRELYMNLEQIRCMRDCGMFFGVHGYDHFWLGDLPEDKMRQDIDKGLEVMNEIIEPNRWVMNYPYGSCNDSVIEYVRSKGCALGLGTEVRVANLNEDNIYNLPRFDCNDFPPKSENYKKFLKMGD